MGKHMIHESLRHGRPTASQNLHPFVDFRLEGGAGHLIFSSMPTISTAEILSVGTELLLGEIVDTNSAWLARQLADRSVDVYWSQRVGDNRQRIRAALEQALSRSDLVLVSGGLGPTDDDTTREAVADTVAETPVVDDALAQALRDRFASFGRAMPEKNLKQAWRIPSAEILPNPLGTAPGWFVRAELAGASGWIATLPGPPRELERMFLQEVLPRLELPRSTFYAKTFKTFGLGESTVAERLGHLTEGANPSVATYAKADGVWVRVAAKADTQEQAEAIAAHAEARVREVLAEHIWGGDGDDLPELVLGALRRRGGSVAVIEHGSAARLSAVLCDAAGDDGTFKGGVIPWAPQASSTEDAFDAAMFDVPTTEAGVAAAARSVRIRLSATHGVAVGKPRPATAGDAFETVLAVADEREVATQTLRLPGLGTDWLRERLCYSALFRLWSQLQDSTKRAP